MPHIIIEHSNNLPIDVQELVSLVHETTQSTALFDATTIKTRAQSFDHYQIQAGKEGFVHIQAHIMHGRSELQKQLLSHTLLYALQEEFNDNWLLSVHPYDLLPQVYRKN